MKPEDPYPTSSDSQYHYIDAFGLDVHGLSGTLLCPISSSQKRYNEDRIEHGPDCTSGGSAVATHI